MLNISSNIKTKDYIFIIFVLSFIYNLYNNPENRRFVSILLLILILLYFRYEQPNFNNNINSSKETLKTKIVSKILKNIINYTGNITIPNIYPISKIPKRFVFIQQNEYIYNIIFDLRFIERFNKDSYYKFIILTEYFLKYYYKTITNEYDYKTVIEMLISIRKNILNILTEQVFSIPTSLNLPNTDFDIKNTDKYLEHNINKFRAFSYKKIKILSNKNKIDNKSNKTFGYKAPFQSNLYNNIYEIF